MQLVDYGSDDDSASETIATPPAPARAAAGPSKPSGGLFASLPPAGKGKLGLALPAPSSSKPSSGLALPPPKKRGPVKIVLDSNAASRADTDDDETERARKRARTAMSGSGGGLKGLAGMLPAPKTAPTAAAVPEATAPTAHADDAERSAMKAMLDGAPAAPTPTSSTAFVPHTTAKAKAAVQSTPATDFFSLGATSSAPRPSSDGPSMSISAAPVLAEPEPEPPKPNLYSTLEPPSLSNPYPGFHPLPSGDWTPDDPEAWAEWVQINGWDKPAAGAGGDGMVDVKGHDPKAPKVPKLEKPGRVAADDNRQAPQIRKSQNSLAKGRHQLSHMLHSAYENRQELEDRIAAAKANRKSSSVKYGF